MFDFYRQALLSSLKRIILFISISYFCEFSHFSVPAMYDLRGRKGKARMIWKNMNETCLHLFSSCTGKKKTLRLDFATVVDNYSDLVIIL